MSLSVLVGPAGHEAPARRGPVADPRFAHQVIDWYEPPQVGIGAVWPVVAEDKIVAVGHLFGLTVERIGVSGRIVNVVLSQGFAVDVDNAVLDQDRVTGQADHPLDEVFVRLRWRTKHDDVAALRP